MKLTLAIVQLIAFIAISESFRLSPIPRLQLHARRVSSIFQSAEDTTTNSKANNDFDPEAFYKALGDVALEPKPSSRPDTKEYLDGLRERQVIKYLNEESYNRYPFENLSLPVLDDVNNYYSGKFQPNYIWHQNADQLLVYLPMDTEGWPKDIDPKHDVKAKFEVQNIKITVKDQVVLETKLFDRIIPSGSFWLLETSPVTNQKYIQLDLEKRFRMINWNKLGADEMRDAGVNIDETRKDLLRKIYDANKGMSKINGARPETEEDMMKNKELMRMISSDVDTETKVISSDGSVLDLETVAEAEDEMRGVTEKFQEFRAAKLKELRLKEKDKQFADVENTLGSPEIEETGEYDDVGENIEESENVEDEEKVADESK